MATPYNHRAIEQKWRKNWEEHPVNVNDGKKPKYYCVTPDCGYEKVEENEE